MFFSCTACSRVSRCTLNDVGHDQQKYGQYGFSTPRSSKDSSDSLKACFTHAARPANACLCLVLRSRGKAISKDTFEAFSVNLLFKNAQRMVEIQQLFALSLKQVQLDGLGADRGCMPLSNCKVLVLEDPLPCNLKDTNLVPHANRRG